MHNDGEIVDDSAERLIALADNLIEKNIKWGLIFTRYDVFCAFSTKCVEAIGKWGDEKWPKDQQSGYYLDEDYYRRMKINGFTHYQLDKFNVLHNEDSNTIRDPIEKQKWDSQQHRVSTHYKNKWGGLPNNETYLYPLFN
jgi:hypothetical protein